MTHTEEDPVTVVVIDDDPTGAQTLRDVPLLFGIDPSTILDGLRSSKPVLCILTNSRALSAEAAAAANHRIAGLLREAPTPPLVVSRGDSTLRGNLKAETEAIIAELWPDTPVTRVFVPAFVEAGRTTLGGVHYVNVDGKPEPVGETPYARDARFGFSSSRLSDYLVEMGVVEDASEVVELHRDGYDADPSAVAGAIAEASGKWIVVDAVEDAEIDAIAAAVRRRHAAGQPVLVRCAPSLVRALAGQPTRPALSDEELREHFPGRRGHGLVAVGSHVPQTTRQLAELRTLSDIHSVEVELDVLLDDSDERRGALVDDIVALLESTDVVLSTPRAELRDDSPDGSLAHRFSQGFCAIVDAASRRAHPAWVIAKGGITSHDTAEIALGIRSADVVGQLFDSRVSIVRPTSAPEHVDGMPYVIFPGNVGGDEDLKTAVERMRMLAE